MIGESRSTVGNLFSTNWPIVQISHWTAIAEWHGETRAGALIGDRRDRIRVCDGVTESSGEGKKGSRSAPMAIRSAHGRRKENTRECITVSQILKKI